MSQAKAKPSVAVPMVSCQQRACRMGGLDTLKDKTEKQAHKQGWEPPQAIKTVRCLFSRFCQVSLLSVAAWQTSGVWKVGHPIPTTEDSEILIGLFSPAEASYAVPGFATATHANLLQADFSDRKAFRKRG